MPSLLAFETNPVPDGLAVPSGAPLILSLAVLTFGLFAAMGAIAASHGYQAPVIAELVRSVFGQEGFIEFNFVDSLGQGLTIATLTFLRALPGLSVSGLPFITALAAALFCAVFARLLDRQCWPAWQIYAAVGAVALNPLFLYAATTGTTMIFSGLVFFAIAYSCERLEYVGDIQAQMNVGLVLGAMVFVEPLAVYLLMPILTIMPIMYRDIETPAAAFAAYLMVVLPALIAVSTFAFLHMILSPEPLSRPFKLWASPLHGAVDVIDQYDWILAFGGDFFTAAGMLALGALVCVPGVAVLCWRFVSARAERASPGTALITLVVPILAGALATSQVHARSAWPFVLAVLLAFLVWLATKPLPGYVRRVALAAMFTGTFVAWLYPPLWAERGAAAWRTALIRDVAESTAWPATPVRASWFDMRFATRLLPPEEPDCRRSTPGGRRLC